jgi:hypothetical protein
MTDKHIADLSADKSADNSVLGKLRIDRPYLTAMENNWNWLRSVDNRTLRSGVHHRYIDYVQPILYQNRMASRSVNISMLADQGM